MTVFTSRIRAAHLRKRSASEMYLATIILLSIIAACGLAGSTEEKDARMMSEETSSRQIHRRVVASWDEKHRWPTSSPAATSP